MSRLYIYYLEVYLFFMYISVQCFLYSLANLYSCHVMEKINRAATVVILERL